MDIFVAGRRKRWKLCIYVNISSHTAYFAPAINVPVVVKELINEINCAQKM